MNGIVPTNPLEGHFTDSVIVGSQHYGEAIEAHWGNRRLGLLDAQLARGPRGLLTDPGRVAAQRLDELAVELVVEHSSPDYTVTYDDVLRCVLHDPSVDPQLEDRARYYAELLVALDYWLRRIPEFTLADSLPRGNAFGGPVMGFRSLPLVWQAG